MHELALQLVALLEDRLLASDFLERCLKFIHSDTIRVLLFINTVHHVTIHTLLLEDLSLFTLESLQLALNIGLVEVQHVRSIVEFGELVVSPLFLFKHVVLFNWNVEVASTTIFFLELLDSLSLFLNALKHSVRDGTGTFDVVALLWLSYVNSV